MPNGLYEFATVFDMAPPPSLSIFKNTAILAGSLKKMFSFCWGGVETRPCSNFRPFFINYSLGEGKPVFKVNLGIGKVRWRFKKVEQLA